MAIGIRWAMPSLFLRPGMICFPQSRSPKLDIAWTSLQTDSLSLGTTELRGLNSLKPNLPNILINLKSRLAYWGTASAYQGRASAYLPCSGSMLRLVEQ